jgi:pyruvate dehydrogenase E2 component (dihydrolipoamide acetyltransferase)
MEVKKDMATTIVMPQLAETMEKATIVQWLKQVGDEVAEGEAIIEITTDKVDVEVESPASGVLLKIMADAGDEVPVEEPVAILGEAGEAFGDAGVAVSKAAPQTPEVKAEAEPTPEPPKGRIFASPRAKRLAKEAGVDLAAVTGTGPRGRIVSQDVRKYIQEGKRVAVEAKPVAKAEVPVGEVVKLSGIQKTVAERMTMSYRTAPHIDILMDVNCEKMISLRALLSSQGLKVSYNDILAKYTSVVLKEFPRFNSVYAEDGVHLMRDINIGIAVAVGDELIVPVVKNADKKDIAVIASDSARIIDAARNKKLALEDVSGGTLTITNLGMFGVRSFKAIINPPQVAILAVGTIEPRAVVIPGQIIAQQMTTLTLSIDHRVVNGAQGGVFLARLKELIEVGSLDVLMNRL